MATMAKVGNKLRKVESTHGDVYSVDTVVGRFVFETEEMRYGVRMIRDDNDGLFTVLDSNDTRIVCEEYLNDDGTVEDIYFFLICIFKF